MRVLVIMGLEDRWIWSWGEMGFWGLIEVGKWSIYTSSGCFLLLFKYFIAVASLMGLAKLTCSLGSVGVVNYR